MATVSPNKIQAEVFMREEFGGRRTAPWRGLRLTIGGLIYLVVLSIILSAALNSDANLLLLLAGVGLGALLFNAFACMGSVRKVNAERLVSSAVIAGRPFKLSYIIRNRRRWFRSWALRVGEIPSTQRYRHLRPGFVPMLGPGDEQRLELSGVLPHRGKVKLAGIRISSRFPFGLVVCAIDITMPGELIVYPRIGRFRRNPWKDTTTVESSSSGLRREHLQDEFYGLREYRQGDNYRWIHWRRSARTGVLLVREMAPVRQQQLIVVVDPWSEGKTIKQAKKRKRRTIDVQAEKTISAAATAICDALQRGQHVGLIARSSVPVVIAPAGGRPQRQRLLRELSLLESGAQSSLEELVSGVRWSSGWQGRCAFCVSSFDRGYEHVLNYLRRQSEKVLVLSPEAEVFNALVDLSASPQGGRRTT
jgi:uncharacterized protein (DUF58 family)